MHNTTHNGRKYILTAYPDELPHLRAEMLRNGWDGTTYVGISEPVGRQRRTMTGTFYRAENTGQFKAICIWTVDGGQKFPRGC